MAKCIAIFDFDYTLAKTNEKIWVWSPRGTRVYDNKKYIPYHPSVLAKINLPKDERIDDSSFKEFYSLDLSRTKPINITMQLLNYHTANYRKYDTYILTARPKDAQNDILNFLQQNKIDTDRVGYMGLKNSDPKMKIEFIKSVILNKRYNSIFIYEDNSFVIKNIHRSGISIPIYRYHVETKNKETRVTLYEN